MSSVTRPRGPLSARVYWARRLVALGLVLGLVFGASHLLGGNADRSAVPSARPAAAPTASGSAATGSTAPSPSALETLDRDGGSKKSNDDQGKSTPLALPTGPCEDADVSVRPSVEEAAHALSAVELTLNLRTIESSACTWEVSPDSVVLKVTSGTDRIWTTQDCTQAVETKPVVVRRDHTTEVEVSWSGQRSDEGCTRTPEWALPGFYHVSAAAYGAEPADDQFELLAPVARTITPKPTVDPADKRAERKAERRAERRAEPKTERKAERRAERRAEPKTERPAEREKSRD